MERDDPTEPVPPAANPVPADAGPAPVALPVGAPALPALIPHDRLLLPLCLGAFLLWIWLVAGFRFIVPSYESEIFPFVKVELPWPTQLVLYFSTPVPLMVLAATGFAAIAPAAWFRSRKLAVLLVLLAALIIPVSFACLNLPYAQPLEVQRPP